MIEPTDCLIDLWHPLYPAETIENVIHKMKSSTPPHQVVELTRYPIAD